MVSPPCAAGERFLGRVVVSVVIVLTCAISESRADQRERTRAHVTRTAAPASKRLRPTKSVARTARTRQPRLRVRDPRRAQMYRGARLGRALRPGRRTHLAHRRPAPRLTPAVTRHRLIEAGIPEPFVGGAFEQVALGMPTPAGRLDPDDYLLARNEYVISYNRSRSAPNWASWKVDAGSLGPIKRRDDFRADPTLPDDWRRATDDDYKGSGFTRGHLVASGERTRTRRANSKTFVFTNMVPQAKNNNAGPWLHLEEHYRNLAARHGKTVYVTAGGLYGPRTRRIGDGRGVAVPEATWKVAVILDRGQTLADIGPDTRVISVIVPNDDTAVSRAESYADYRVRPRDIEERAGVQLFSHLAPGQRRALLDKLDDRPVPSPKRLQRANHQLGRAQAAAP